MIPGFNHNIKHKGRIYHIQTEDSGPKNPHIITHLFVGGNILASKKTQYADIVDQPSYEKTVRSMMEEQHKQMLRNLVNGVYDNVGTSTAYHLDGPAPMNFTATSPATSSIAGAQAFKGLPSQSSGVPRVGTPAPVAMDYTRPAGGVAVHAQPFSAPPVPVVDAHVADADRPRPSMSPGTIFGEDLISEKSLDEVILSYLAEDLADVE